MAIIRKRPKLANHADKMPRHFMSNRAPNILEQKRLHAPVWHKAVHTNERDHTELVGSAQTFISAEEWHKHCVGNKARLAISRAKKARAALRRYKAETGS